MEVKKVAVSKGKKKKSSKSVSVGERERGAVSKGKGKSSVLEGVFLSDADLGELIGVTSRFVRILETEGVISRLDGGFPASESLKGLFAYYRKGRGSNYREKQEEMKAKMLEVEYWTKLGELVPKDFARELLQRVFSNFRKSLDETPDAVAAKANPADPEHAHAVIDEYVQNRIVKPIYNSILEIRDGENLVESLFLRGTDISLDREEVRENEQD